MTAHLWLDAVIILGGIGVVFVVPAVAICIGKDWIKRRSELQHELRGFEVKLKSGEMPVLPKKD